MKYFQILSDARNPQPRFIDWHKKIKPVRWSDQDIYQALKDKNYFKVELNIEVPFLDVISSPYFMVSKEFAYVLKLYDSRITFKKAYLHDEKSKRSALYFIPKLMEVDALADESECSIDKSRIVKGILVKEKIEPYPVFKLSGVNGRFIIGNLELLESVYRRKVMGMSIREFMLK